MGLEEEQAVPHTKTGHVIYVTDKCFSVEWLLENPFCSLAPWKWPTLLQDITQLSEDLVSMGWPMLSMSSTEENRHTQSISSPTRSWSQRLLHRPQQLQSRRPSECPLVKARLESDLGLDYSGLFPTKSQYSINPLQLMSCLSFLKHYCSGEGSTSNWHILNCYCSFGGVFTGWPLSSVSGSFSLELPISKTRLFCLRLRNGKTEYNQYWFRRSWFTHYIFLLLLCLTLV